MTERATCWSITINNPTEEEKQYPNLPAGWVLQGQLERGEEGTEHIQAMLTTPQVRFSAVKRHFPRAHIEIARNKNALQAYVHKPESRVAALAPSAGMTAFQLTDQICARWDDEAFKRWKNLKFEDPYLTYADSIVKDMIREGASGGIEYVAINPMWRSAWKRFGEVIVFRKNVIDKHKDAPPHEEGEEARASQGEARSVTSVEESDGECNGIV